MGNECCGAERRERKSAFNEHEKAQLRGLYYRLSESRKKYVDIFFINILF